jgi:hypothetical protein
MQENFHLFFANLTAAPVAVTDNDKSGREKKRIIWWILNENNFNNKYFKLTLMNHPYLR